MCTCVLLSIDDVCKPLLISCLMSGEVTHSLEWEQGSAAKVSLIIRSKS